MILKEHPWKGLDSGVLFMFSPANQLTGRRGTDLLKGLCMRRVEILEEPKSQRCWVARDMKSGQPVMRMHDKELLQKICQGLDWKIVQTAAAGSRSAQA